MMIVLLAVILGGVYSLPTLANPISSQSTAFSGTFSFHIPDNVFSSTKEMSVFVTSKPQWMTVNYPIIKTLSSFAAAEHVTSSGSFVYVTCNIDGIRVVNASNDIVGSLDTYGALGIDVLGDHAYVADHGGGLVVVDISDPLDPRSVGTRDTNGYAPSVKVLRVNAHTYAYLADNAGGFKVINVTKPNAPVIVGDLIQGEIGNINGVDVVYPYAYLGDTKSDSFKTVDVSDPTNPTIVTGGSYAMVSPLNLQVVYPLAYVSDTGSGVKILNVSNVASPKLVKFISSSIVDPRDIYISGSYAYVSDYTKGLKIFDIRDINNIELVGETTTTNPKGVHAVGSRAFVADYTSGLRIISLGEADLGGNCIRSHTIEITATDADGSATTKFNVNCTCSGGWEGPVCTSCPVVCLNNGNHNPSCENCTCFGGWTGGQCQDCDLCKNGGTHDSECRNCSCTNSWSGKTCETCALCKNGGVHDSECKNCTCMGGTGWIGPTCGNCGSPSCESGASKVFGGCLFWYLVYVLFWMIMFSS